MKTFLLLLSMLPLLSLSGCLSYNYGVKREGSPIPFGNFYESDDKDDYEFTSVLYALDESHEQKSYVELMHMNDVYNWHKNTPKGTWRRSFLNFSFRAEDHVNLVPGSVSLAHYGPDGAKIDPLEVSSSLDKCGGGDGRCSLVISYPKGLSKKLTEKVSFMLIINGERKEYVYEIPLEYKYDYSFFDVMMGV